MFGATCCAECGINYGTYMSVMEYINSYLEMEGADINMKVAQLMAYDCYGAKLKFNVPKDCSKCSSSYKFYRMMLVEEFEAFTKAYERQKVAEMRRDYDSDYDYDYCTASTGMCRCCGECPS